VKNEKEIFFGVHDQQEKQLFTRKNDLIIFKVESRSASNRRLMKINVFN
jgi:hypothetical protein